jgi:hypothetical protein
MQSVDFWEEVVRELIVREQSLLGTTDDRPFVIAFSFVLVIVMHAAVSRIHSVRSCRAPNVN